MTIPFKPGWKSKILAIKLQIYSLGNKAWRIIDNTFDKMQKQGRLEYTTDPTLFRFLVFVIYKTYSHSKKKGHAIVDIRKFNVLVLPNFYLLLF